MIGGGALAEQVNRFASKLTDAVYSYGPEPTRNSLAVQLLHKPR